MHQMTSVATPSQSQAPPTIQASTTSHVSWMPSKDLDAREWAMAGRRIGAVGRSIQWLLGDWIAYGNEKFGERYARASKITGYDTQTLMNMVYVASRFPISRRRETLSWSHHETVAALGDEDQDHWLDLAAEHRWSVADLRMMLRMSRKEGDTATTVAGDPDAAVNGGQKERVGRSQVAGGQRSGPAPSATVVTCPRCGEEIPCNEEMALVPE